MTEKGNEIKEKLLYFLERNPDGLGIGRLTNLINVSRNSIYRYLNELNLSGKVYKNKNKIWKLKEPIKPYTILGYQYQAVLQGLKEIGGSDWDMETEKGRYMFKKLGEFIYPKLKIHKLNIKELKDHAHQLNDILKFSMKLLKEASTVEKFNYTSKLNSEGFPNRKTHLVGNIEMSGGYIESDPVSGNGFAHYYIIAGIIEAAARSTIIPVYGGRVVVDVFKIDSERRIVDLAIYVYFDRQTPFIDPHSGKIITSP